MIKQRFTKPAVGQMVPSVMLPPPRTEEQPIDALLGTMPKHFEV